MQTLLTRARLRPRCCSSLSDVSVSGWSLGPCVLPGALGPASVHEWRGRPYSPAYFLGRPPPPGNGLPVAFVRFLTKAPSPGGLHCRHGIRRTPIRPFQCPPGLQPKHHSKQFDGKQNIYALMANKMFTRLWTTSWRKWKERQISKLHVRQTLFVIRMLEAPFDFIGTSEIKVRP